MAHPPIPIEEDPALQPLTQLLATIERPGDYFSTGRREVALPKITAKGGGQLSFPVPAKQAQEWLRLAEVAPYGRGEETVVDPAVRKVWQMAPDQVKITGKSWDATLEGIVTTCARELGCLETPVLAEFYKLLIYGPGSFFVTHRDTEKAPGMFGTLVISLPSRHAGGDLVIRHQGREATLSLLTEEPSELAYAAFYADCQHEVLPITKGYRVCLVYNLIQGRAHTGSILAAPDHRPQAVEATRLLRTWFGKPPAARKLVCLLDHEYTPEGLGFTALKNRDAAVAKVLRDAAEAADLALHLAIVHIEETGAAEIVYEPRSSRRWRDWSDDEEEPDDDADFEIAYPDDPTFDLDGFRAITGEVVDFGKLRFQGAELLPIGALKDEPPDEQRVTEATGNTGATYERSYHRACLVLWPRVRTGEILLEGGPASALPYLRELTDQWIAGNKGEAPGRGKPRTALLRLAEAILDRWGAFSEYDAAPLPEHRRAWWDILDRMGHSPLVKPAVSRIAVRWFDGAEALPLARACLPLGPKGAVEELGEVISARFSVAPEGCVALLRAFLDEVPRSPQQWKESIATLGSTIVERLGTVRLPVAPPRYYGRYATYSPPVAPRHPVDSGFVIRLVAALEEAGGTNLVTSGAEGLNAHPFIFPPITVLAPALAELAAVEATRKRASFRILWEATATALIGATDAAPRVPKDWSQRRRVKCGCEWCIQINAFAAHPDLQTFRIKANTDDRGHMHREIDGAGLEMTHVTERRGRPYILVLAKDRRDHQKAAIRFGEDLLAAGTLFGIAPDGGGALVTKLRENLSRAGRESP